MNICRVISERITPKWKRFTAKVKVTVSKVIVITQLSAFPVGPIRTQQRHTACNVLLVDPVEMEQSLGHTHGGDTCQHAQMAGESKS